MTPLPEWQEEMARHGKLDCKFLCPVCGNTASPNDWRALMPTLEDPGRAAQECIGRIMPEAQRRKAFPTEDDPRTPERPCDYAAFGLFRLAPVEVDGGGKIISVFAFADSTTPEGTDQ